jgi:predicted dehydrogenase
MRRRTLLSSALAPLAMSAAPRRRYRAAVIGHTGRGNYGHGLDTVWQAFDFVDTVAVADPDEPGLAKALVRTGAQRGYRDYREMLAKEKPDLVSIGPRHLDQRVPMVEAAAAAGAHIYMEKAFAANLADADRMVDAIRRAGIKVQIAHQMRRSPFLLRARQLVQEGAIGRIQEVRGRGKEDARAGGEDLIVLGVHICDVMRSFLGDPLWVSAHVTDRGAELTPAHRRQPTEAVGPVAGTEIAAMFAFPGAVHGYFASKAAPKTDPLRFATQILGTEGVILLPNAIYPGGQAWLLRSPAWHPSPNRAWEKIEPLTAIPGMVELRGGEPLLANALMALDLIDTIEHDRKPACSEVDGRWTLEMVSGIYASERAGARVPLPLADRRHPLDAY